MSLDEYRKKRNPKRDPGAVRRDERRAKLAADLRRPAPRRPPAPLRLPSRAGRRRSPRGRCRRASRSSPERGRSPSTSRTIRSSTRRSTARSRRASTAPARSRSGTAAPTSSSRRSGTASSPSALHGTRLNGRWTLVPARLDGKEQNWLLIKGHDEAAEEIVQGEYRPMLATQEERIPHGEGWTFEVKFDGYRALAYVRGGECRLVSRNGNDLTGRFPDVAKALVKAVRSPNAVVDGEVARIDTTGRTSFSELQQGSGQLVYYAFDLLELDGRPLVDLPLHERKDRLREADRPAHRLGCRLRGIRRRRRAVRGRPRPAPRRDHREARRLDLQVRAPHARLVEAEDREHRRVRRRRLHARLRAAAPARSARWCSLSTRTASCATSAMSAPGSTTPRSAVCSSC